MVKAPPTLTPPAQSRAELPLIIPSLRINFAYRPPIATPPALLPIDLFAVITPPFIIKVPMDIYIPPPMEGVTLLLIIPLSKMNPSLPAVIYTHTAAVLVGIIIADASAFHVEETMIVYIYPAAPFSKPTA
jgi:hypothetical protein